MKKARQDKPLPVAKLEYHKPRILSRDRLEVVAVVCVTKADPVSCPSAPLNS